MKLEWNHLKLHLKTIHFNQWIEPRYIIKNINKFNLMHLIHIIRNDFVFTAGHLSSKNI